MRALVVVGLFAVAVLVQVALRPGPTVIEEWTQSQVGDRVEVLGSSGERVVVWPVVMRNPAADPTPLLRGMAERVWPGAHWDAPVAARMRGRRGGDAGVARLECAGASATFTFLCAPAERLAEVEEALWALAANCRSAAPVEFVSWTDPNEAAFSVDVPAGWTVRGGTMRLAPHVVQSYVEARSRNGGRIWAGDYAPMYAMPDPARGPSGSQEMDAGGYPWIVAPYAPGAEAAMRFLPEGAQVVRAERLLQLGDAGWVEYTLGDRRGVALCVTERHDTWWRVERVYIAEAPEGAFAEALAALARLAESMHGGDPASLIVRAL